MENIQFQLTPEQQAFLTHEIHQAIGTAVNSFSTSYQLEHPYMKKRELERYLHLSNNSIDKLVRAGLPRICVQGVTLYSKKQVDEWLERHKVGD